jgi:hypothetical protein
LNEKGNFWCTTCNAFHCSDRLVTFPRMVLDTLSAVGE